MFWFFWGIYAIDRELVYPSFLDEYVPYIKPCLGMTLTRSFTHPLTIQSPDIHSLTSLNHPIYLSLSHSPWKSLSLTLNSITLFILPIVIIEALLVFKITLPIWPPDYIWTFIVATCMVIESNATSCKFSIDHNVVSSSAENITNPRGWKCCMNGYTQLPDIL